MNGRTDSLKRIAIVTGASSGMGRLFALTAHENVPYDELWIIARRLDRLEEVAEKLKGREVRCISHDLSKDGAASRISEMLDQEKAEVVLLINGAGFGMFNSVEGLPEEISHAMLNLNCKSLMNMCCACLPYMHKDAKILNIASVAAFQPVPYLTEYAATKAFVLSFSRGLWKELRRKGITVTALCPYWTRTEFFSVANSRPGDEIVTVFNAMYNPEDVVERGWRDLMKGRDVSTYGFIARMQLVLIKLLPHRLVMWIWCRQQDFDQ